MISILIVEDEAPIAEYIASLVRDIWSALAVELSVVETIGKAKEILGEKEIDLCLLDIHVYGENGYQLLKEFRDLPFHTIVISANRERAVEAFEHDVLDFVPKPFSRSRLAEALNRFTVRSKNKDFFRESIFSEFSGKKIRYQLNECVAFEANHMYSKVYFRSGKSELIDKPLGDLEAMLPNRFMRCHRSYIIDLTQIYEVQHKGGGKYVAIALNVPEIPVSRSKYKTISALIRSAK